MKRDFQFVDAENSGEPMFAPQNDKDTIGTISGIYNPGRVIAARGWFVMSGATTHACSSRSSFIKYQALKKNLALIDGHRTPVVGVGTVELNLSTGYTLILNDVLHVPSITKGIISASMLTADGYSILLDNGFIIKSNNGPLGFRARGSIVGGLFRVQLAEEHNYKVVTSDDDEDDISDDEEDDISDDDVVEVLNISDDEEVIDISDDDEDIISDDEY